MPHDQPVVRVEAADGHRFELIDVCPRRCRRTLLLLPGLGIAARHYIAFARHLARSGTRVLIHEWRGTGSSDRRAHRARDWGYRELIEVDLDAALAAAHDAAEREPVWLAGHSLGSQLCCILAGRHPERVAGLVLIAGGAPYSRVFPWPMRLALAVVLRLFPLLSRIVGHFPGKRLGFAGTEAHGVMRDWAWTGRTGRYDLPTLGFSPERRMAKLALPVLTVRMGDDGWVPPSSVNYLLGFLPGCRTESAEISSALQGARADHFRWLKSPEAAAAEIDRWLQRAGTQATHRR
jgi:predicted alpha/beta hydrolase